MTQPTDPDTPAVKLNLFGDGGEGKTCFLYRVAHNVFPEDYVPTVFDNYNMEVSSGNKKIILGLWDYLSRDGEDRFLKLTIPGTDVILVCYSVVRNTELQYMKQRWIPQFEQHAPGAPILLVGFKEDLRTEPKYKDQVVTLERAKQLQAELGAVDHLTCSSRTGQGVQEVVDRAVQLALEFQRRGKIPLKTRTNRCAIC